MKILIFIDHLIYSTCTLSNILTFLSVYCISDFCDVNYGSLATKVSRGRTFVCLEQYVSNLYSFFRREDFQVCDFDYEIYEQGRSQSVRSALFFIHEKIKLHETKDFKAQSALSYFVRWLVHLSFLRNDTNTLSNWVINARIYQNFSWQYLLQEKIS